MVSSPKGPQKLHFQVIMHNLNCKIKTCEQIEKYNVCIQNHMIITSPELKVKILR